MVRRTALLLLSLFALTGFISSAHAQDLSNGTAFGIQVNADNVPDGSIISTSADGYVLTFSPYDTKIFGVVSMDPAIYLNDTNAENTVPVISSGQVLVRVSSNNGNVTAGDYLTSSATPGVAQKATENGYVIGTAEEDYANDDPNAEGLILVTLHPHFVQLNDSLLRNSYNAFSFGLDAAFSTPLGVLRYFVAGAITLFSFFFGFRFFAHASNRGVEAIGRNPLAKQAILLSVLINSIITIAIMVLGVAISYLILVL